MRFNSGTWANNRTNSCPIDVIEDLIISHAWGYERRSDDEILVEVPGKWCNFALFFAWSEKINSLHVSCIMDMKIGDKEKSKIYELLALANERIWLGHFSLWTDDAMPVFRHSIMLDNAERMVPERIVEIIKIAVDECQRFYPAFQYVMWGGKKPADAIDLVMMDTIGQAC